MWFIFKTKSNAIHKIFLDLNCRFTMSSFNEYSKNELINLCDHQQDQIQKLKWIIESTVVILLVIAFLLLISILDYITSPEYYFK